MLIRVNHICPASGNPSRESRPAGDGIKYRILALQHGAQMDASFLRLVFLKRLSQVFLSQVWT
jgi:hypothetical protein